MSALITALELQKILQQPHVKILDVSYGQPPSGQGIPGAMDFDIDDVADPKASLPHTVPSAEVFAERVGAFGIGNDDLVVVYDRTGFSMAAARGWWMFRLFGHDQVKILNGGLPAWIRAGGVVVQKSVKPLKPASFKTSFKPHLLKLREQILKNISAKDFTLLDARDAGRFRGDAPEPRPHVQPGHIPGSVSTPYMNLMNLDATLKSEEQLAQIFQTRGVRMHNKLACSCGSGVTACVVALALYELGCQDAAVYDGSWVEWGSDPALPKAKGD
ncbi:MAG: sulfurtransferase [Proteobacteria bacterium]|nr:sulfurtransferase [Pseudomonadota bacterium]